jgi:hypothetical protein
MTTMTQVCHCAVSELRKNSTKDKGKDKVKGKDHLRTSHEGPEVEEKYNSTLSLTSALHGGGPGLA